MLSPSVTSLRSSPVRTTCVGYCRVSTVEQAEHGWSIDQQEESIRARAEADGLTVLGVFRDAGRSGRTMQGRPGLRALLELVATGSVGVVIAKAQDRVARAVDHALGLRRWLNHHGADLLFLDGDIRLHADELSHGGNLGTDLLASLTAILAEEEIATLRRRILPNLVSAVRSGRRGGRVPLGYQRQTDGTVVVNHHDADLVARAVAAVQSGTGPSQLSRHWVATGVRDSTGACISFDRLRGALTNPYLTGALIYRVPADAVSPGTPAEIRIPNHHPPLIDPVSFAALQHRLRRPSEAGCSAARAQQRRHQRRSVRMPADGDLLKALQPASRPVHGSISPDILRCGTCDGPMYASLMTVGARGRRSRRAVYICRYHKDRGAAFCAQGPVPVDAVDDLVVTTVRAQLRDARLGTPGAGGGMAATSATAGMPDAAASAAAAEAAAAASAERDRLQHMVVRLGAQAPTVLVERATAAAAEAQRLATRAAGCGETGRPSMLADRQRQLHPTVWAGRDAAHRRTVLAQLLARVVVRGTTVTSIAIRLDAGGTVTVQRPASEVAP